MDVKGQNHELLPFGSGRRSCPGVGLALQVMHLTLARILQAFELNTHPNVGVDLEECSGILLSMMHPLQVISMGIKCLSHVAQIDIELQNKSPMVDTLEIYYFVMDAQEPFTKFASKMALEGGFLFAISSTKCRLNSVFDLFTWSEVNRDGRVTKLSRLDCSACTGLNR
ncbi:hypothetical protein Sjap_005405 [Stephania japonica]|uniref:Cytochrome P450 n=1 Tax=Stephania japonica TaxID=461633 RepID=A0AAP0K6B3_9MAGN